MSKYLIHRGIVDTPYKYPSARFVQVEPTKDMVILHELFKFGSDGTQSGDLSLLTSDNANPALKEFAEKYLFKKFGSQSSYLSDQMTDEELLELMPRRGEDYNDFVDRVRPFVNEGLD